MLHALVMNGWFTVMLGSVSLVLWSYLICGVKDSRINEWMDESVPIMGCLAFVPLCQFIIFGIVLHFYFKATRR